VRDGGFFRALILVVVGEGPGVGGGARGARECSSPDAYSMVSPELTSPIKRILHAVNCVVVSNPVVFVKR
jgi:hypothetical protein